MLLALCLLVVGVNLLYVEQISVARDLRTQEDRARALLLAQEWLELSAGQLPTLGPRTWRSDLQRRYGMDSVLEVHPHPTQPLMREVVITVTWHNVAGGPPHSLRLARLVADRLPPGP